MKLQLTAWALCLPLLAFAQPTNIVIDGEITGAETNWGSPLSTSSGGPGPGFGAGHEINSIYVRGDADNFYFFIGGNVQNGNRILLFIDSQTGGFNNGGFGRLSSTEGIDDFNSGTSFDAGFNADYCLVIGTNIPQDNYFFNLYTLSGNVFNPAEGGPNNYLGDKFSSNLAANPANDSETRGFELRISKTDLGYPTGLPAPNPIQVFAAYISDGGFLSNQFLTPAGGFDGNYGSGAVTFSAASPNPITVSNTLLPIDLTSIEAISSDNNIDLHWTTASELNNAYFEIWSSRNGMEWNNIGQVQGAGTATTENHYTFTDYNPAMGENYYRLKQVDFNGAYEYSEIVSAALRGSSTISLSPNPASDVLYITSGTDLHIYDAMGNMVFSALTGGSFVDISMLASGIYFVQLQNSAEQRTEKLIIQ